MHLRGQSQEIRSMRDRHTHILVCPSQWSIHSALVRVEGGSCACLIRGTPWWLPVNLGNLAVPVSNLHSSGEMKK